MPELEVETPGGAAATAKPAKKKSAKKKSLLPPVRIAAPKSAIESGTEILFKVKRLHGFHGTAIDVNDDGSVLCRINEPALEGEVVIFAADQLVPVSHPKQLAEHSSTRLPWDYKD